jgi:hypothetical protein
MPDATPSHAYSLVPWVRRGLASLTPAATDKNYAMLQVALDVNGQDVAGPQIRLLGPGEVTSMDVAAVIRTDPRDGADAFEPNYLASVELALPDLPWLFSPAAPDGAKLRPWICLIVVVESNHVSLVISPGGPAVLHLDEAADLTAELPDLTHVDAWAHAQVIVDNSTGAALDGAAVTTGSVDCRVAGPALNAALDANSAARLARLVAPHKLAANQEYLACIVPTYRAGVNAGLGLPVNEKDLAPAWGADTKAPLQLPVYYYFRFRTGPGGDFASLAAKIVPPATPFAAGKRAVDVSAPNFGADPAPGVSLDFEGAMRARGEAPSAWPANAQSAYENQLRNALMPPAANDPVVAPPVYGRTQSGKELPKAQDPPVWLRELNLDPRMRAAAGAAAQVVQRDQEALAAAAWDQLGEINKANQLLRQAQLARAASVSMSRRHLAAVSDDGAYLQITAPVHGRVGVTLGGRTLTLRSHVETSRLPVGALSGTMRKLARGRGPIGRQLPRGPRLVDRLNLPADAGPAALTAAGPLQPPRGMVALDDVSRDVDGARDVQVGNMTSAISATAPGWITVRERTGSVGGTASGRLVDWDSDPDVPELLKGTHANLPAPLLFPSDAQDLQKMVQDFRTAAGAINQQISTVPAVPPDAPPLGGSAALTPARTELQKKLDPEKTIAARFGARIPLGARPDPLQPLSIAPQFPQPMYSALSDLSSAWMVPGVDKMPANSAVLLQANPRFVEAFMVGLNEAFAGELLWREFPVGRSQTYFRNFWGGPTLDIQPIDTFDPNGTLGDHTADHATGGNLVLLIRADLFRRYPNTVVSAVNATWDGTRRRLGDTRKWPLFRGAIGADLNFFGFDIADPQGPDPPTANNAGWYFVLEEHVAEPRFGLEPETSPAGSSWNDLRWSDLPDRPFLDPASGPAPREGVAWGESAAAMAFILMRRPRRVAMHGRALLAAVGT